VKLLAVPLQPGKARTQVYKLETTMADSDATIA